VRRRLLSYISAMTAPNQIGPQVRIRALRQARGLSIPQLVALIRAFSVDVHKDAISNIELGHRRASSDLLSAWARALGLDPQDVTQPDPASAGRRSA